MLRLLGATVLMAGLYIAYLYGLENRGASMDVAPRIHRLAAGKTHDPTSAVADVQITTVSDGGVDANPLVVGKQAVDIGGVEYSVVDADWMIKHLGCTRAATRCDLPREMIGKRVVSAALTRYTKEHIRRLTESTTGEALAFGRGAGITDAIQRRTSFHSIFIAAAYENVREDIAMTLDREGCWEYCEFLLYGELYAVDDDDAQAAVLVLDGFYHVRTIPVWKAVLTSVMSPLEIAATARTLGVGG